MPFKSIEAGRTLPYWLAYVAAASFWVIIDSLIAPDPPGTDIFLMKDAGVNLAFGHGYVSCATPDNPSLHYETHASYPSLYPLLYAAYVRLFGFGITQNSYFELAISLLRNAALLCAGLLVIEGSKGRWAWVAFCAATATVSLENDRPDNLSLAVTLFALRLIRVPKVERIVGASLLNFINLGLSPFGGLTAVTVCGGLLLHELGVGCGR